MAKIKLCEIVEGRVTNIALADSDNIPGFMSEWVPATPSARIGSTWSGTRFGPIPQAEIAAKLEAEIAAEAELLETQGLELAELLGVNVNPAQLKARARARAEAKRATPASAAKAQ